MPVVWIAESIESCLIQTYSQVEIIFVDDGSTDQSLEKIKEYGNRIRWQTGLRATRYAFDDRVSRFVIQ